MPALREIFLDFKNQLSYGRVASGYALVVAVFIFAAGVLYPAQSAYCQEAYKSFLWTAIGFYGGGKMPETAANAFKKVMGSLPTNPSEPAPTTTEGSDGG